MALLILGGPLAACGKMGELERPGLLRGGRRHDPREEEKRRDPQRSRGTQGGHTAAYRADDGDDRDGDHRGVLELQRRTERQPDRRLITNVQEQQRQAEPENHRAGGDL